MRSKTLLLDLGNSISLKLWKFIIDWFYLCINSPIGEPIPKNESTTIFRFSSPCFNSR